MKYHLGYEGERTVDGKAVAITLAYNPSHLEAVNPVVLGRARARVDLQDKATRAQTLPVLIHGDAAFAGQGVVMETLNLAGLKGYAVGGTIHLVTNNQVGFTTNPDEGRTGRHCTEIAKFTEAPILHANGDDPMPSSWLRRSPWSTVNNSGPMRSSISSATAATGTMRPTSRCSPNRCFTRTSPPTPR
ncbi:2-oxoglutarate dehydrogenase E1 component [Verrucomicrobiota bacterium]|nr:2-oxoglutarate dehydrogenase E1 component [Verrucomicrobiota bacterium]